MIRLAREKYLQNIKVLLITGMVMSLLKAQFIPFSKTGCALSTASDTNYCNNSNGRCFINNCHRLRNNDASAVPCKCKYPLPDLAKVCSKDGYEFANSNLAAREGYIKSELLQGACSLYGLCQNFGNNTVCGVKNVLPNLLGPIGLLTQILPAISNAPIQIKSYRNLCYLLFDLALPTQNSDCSLNSTLCSISSTICTSGCKNQTVCDVFRGNLTVQKNGLCSKDNLPCLLNGTNICTKSNTVPIEFKVANNACTMNCQGLTPAANSTNCACNNAQAIASCKGYENITYCTTAGKNINPCQYNCNKAKLASLDNCSACANCVNKTAIPVCGYKIGDTYATIFPSECKMQCAGAIPVTNVTKSYCVHNSTNNLGYSNLYGAICANKNAIASVLNGTCSSFGYCDENANTAVCGKKLINNVWSIKSFKNVCLMNKVGYQSTVLSDCSGSTVCSVTNKYCVNNCQDMNACQIGILQNYTLVKNGACNSTAICELSPVSTCFKRTSASNYSYFFVSSNQCDKSMFSLSL
jgi:hypothetical protein